jgi:RimJ/RimL family protein N-acetyltransferase
MNSNSIREHLEQTGEVLLEGVLQVDEELQLVPLAQCNPDDYATAYAAALPDLLKFGAAPPAMTAAEARQQYATAVSDAERGESRGYGVYLHGRLVGEVSISHESPGASYDHGPSMAYWLEPNFRGQGIISRAAKAAAKQYFKTYPNKTHIDLHIAQRNEASKRTAQRLGAVLVGINGDEGWENWTLEAKS